MRKRLRPAHSPDKLANLYQVPHNHNDFPDHIERVNATITLARKHVVARTGADLSCGNGAILSDLDLEERHFGDLAGQWPYEGPIETTIGLIPSVDVFVCCETLEHLDDPDAVLKAIRGKTTWLVLSTPVDAWNDTNEEHYWAWSSTDVDQMLTDAGFDVVAYERLSLSASYLYDFGVWVAK